MVHAAIYAVSVSFLFVIFLSGGGAGLRVEMRGLAGQAGVTERLLY